MSLLLRRGCLYSHANQLPLTDARVGARVRGRAVSVAADEASVLLQPTARCLTARRPPIGMCQSSCNRASRMGKAGRLEETVALGTNLVLSLALCRHEDQRAGSLPS